MDTLDLHLLGMLNLHLMVTLNLPDTLHLHHMDALFRLADTHLVILLIKV